MLSSRYALAIAILCFALFGCSSGLNESRDKQYLKSVLAFHELENQVILTIPLNGCSGCAQQSLTFGKEHFNSSNFYIVLIGDDIKEANYYKKEYFSAGDRVNTLSTQEALANELNVDFPCYYLASNSGLEKTDINAQTLQQSLSKIKSKLE